MDEKIKFIREAKLFDISVTIHQAKLWLYVRSVPAKRWRRKSKRLPGAALKVVTDMMEMKKKTEKRNICKNEKKNGKGKKIEKRD